MKKKALILLAIVIALGLLLIPRCSSEPKPEPLPPIVTPEPLPSPGVEIRGPFPEILKGDDQAEFIVILKGDAENSLEKGEGVRLTQESGDFSCELSLKKLDESVFSVKVSACRGLGSARLALSKDSVQNAEGLGLSEEAESEGVLSILASVPQKAVRAKKKITPPPPAALEVVTPVPTPAPEIIAPEPPLQEDEKIPRHTVIIPRPSEGLFRIRTDLGTYYIQASDPNSTLSVERPVSGNRFVAVSGSGRGKKVRAWKRSDRPGELVSVGENGEFKIDLKGLTEAVAIEIEPVY